jgi:hypothetical protein
MAAEKFTFKVIGQVNPTGWYEEDNTAHYSEQRKVRTETIEKFIGFGENVLAFLVDTNHPNGNERHIITDTGIIKVFNDRTHRHVNDLIARPGQIRRYFRDGRVPAEYRYLLDVARHSQECGYNQV